VDADEIIERLGLEPHPERGWYRRSFELVDPMGGRSLTSAIYFLLRDGESSRWHRIDATEVWHHYAGAPAELAVSVDGRRVQRARLGTELGADEQPQAVVPPGAWQCTRTLGAVTLFGCTVTPAFDFDGFELAPPGWVPVESSRRPPTPGPHRMPGTT
jgi:predicted cupin superfamily sugar epimerase